MGQKQATEDDLVMDLVVNVLKANPDILARYFQETQYSYAPRLKSAWQDNVKLLKKVMVASRLDFHEALSVFDYIYIVYLPRLPSQIKSNDSFLIHMSDLRSPVRDFHSLPNW